MLISIAASPILRRLREVFEMQVVSGPVPAVDALDVPHFFAAPVLAARGSSARR